MNNKRKNQKGFTLIELLAVVVILLAISVCFFVVGIGGMGLFAKNNNGYIDLSTQNSNMVYSQIYDMVTHPSNYNGTTIKAKGTCVVTTNSQTQTLKYSLLIKDALGCCSQGLEFVLASGDYPSDGVEIIVEGVFTSFAEQDFPYYIDQAKIIKSK